MSPILGWVAVGAAQLAQPILRVPSAPSIATSSARPFVGKNIGGADAAPKIALVTGI